jgi:hypothetical protein
VCAAYFEVGAVSSKVEEGAAAAAGHAAGAVSERAAGAAKAAAAAAARAGEGLTHTGEAIANAARQVSL